MEITTFTTTITEHSKTTGAGIAFLGTTFDLSENYLGLQEPAQTQWRCRVTSSLIKEADSIYVTMKDNNVNMNFDDNS